MATKKKTSKKTDAQALVDDAKALVAELTKVTGDIKKITKKSKKHFDAVDTKTKKQVAATIGAFIAILTAKKVVKKISQAKRKK